jgi:hypothetical protein
MSRFVPPWALISLSLSLPQAAFGQTRVLDASILGEEIDRKKATEEIARADGRRFSVTTGLTCAHYRPGRAGDAASAAGANPQIVLRAREIARQENVDEQLFLALIYQESRFNACAVSQAGAIGLTQLMPATAADLGVDPHDIDDNLRGGARYLKQQLSRFNGDRALALAAYNAGPGNVARYGGIPPFRETQGYVSSITQKWLPAFGGISAESVPRSTGGGSEAYANLRDTTFSSMAKTTAISDGSAGVAQFFGELGSRTANTIQESWDQNSTGRNANVEMINQMIVLGTTMAKAMQARQALVASGLSGSARVTKAQRSSTSSDNQADLTCLEISAPTVAQEQCRNDRAGGNMTEQISSLR